MNKVDPQLTGDPVRKAMSRLKGVEFRGPEELAEFLKREGLKLLPLVQVGHRRNQRKTRAISLIAWRPIVRAAFQDTVQR